MKIRCARERCEKWKNEKKTNEIERVNEFEFQQKKNHIINNKQQT